MRKDGNKYVVGSGLSGLIYAFYNPEYKIISSTAGQLKTHDMLRHIVFMHATPLTKKLLIDTGVPYVASTRCIKYVSGSKVSDIIDKQGKLAVIRKKMNDKTFAPKDLKLSTDDYYISTFDFDMDALLEALKPESEIIEEHVIRITKDEIVTDKTVREYSALASTIPADTFWSLYRPDAESPRDIPDTFSVATTFVLSDAPPACLEGQVFNIAYFVDESIPYFRVSHRDHRDHSEFLYEFAGELDDAECSKHCKVLKRFIDIRGALETSDANTPPPKVSFVGRRSVWKHSIKIHDVVEQATFDYDFRTMWNRQMDFSRHYIDLSRIGDVSYCEDLTKTFIMHLLPEVIEVLNETNYKMHKPKRPVDVDKVKMEIIDVFKYLLNLMIVWGISPKELFTMFEEKSTTMEKRVREFRKE